MYHNYESFPKRFDRWRVTMTPYSLVDSESRAFLAAVMSVLFGMPMANVCTL